jgi:hypothetical protein
VSLPPLNRLFQVFNVLFVMFPGTFHSTVTDLISYPSLFQVPAYPPFAPFAPPFCLLFVGVIAFLIL